MSRYQIKSTLESLATSQGFYGRLLNNIESSPYSEEIWTQLENANFQDDIDIILFFET
jgi:hypothetical protein